MVGEIKEELEFPELISHVDQEWLGEGPIRIMFQDGARFGRISDTRRCWCPRPVRPLCHSVATQEYTCTYAVASIDGELDSLILPHVNSICMQVFIDEVASRHPKDRIAMILDGAGRHTSGILKIPENVRLIPLPPYAPELNPAERIWDDLREKAFHNRVFESIDALESRLEVSLREMECDEDRLRSIVAWPWIVNSSMV